MTKKQLQTIKEMLESEIDEAMTAPGSVQGTVSPAPTADSAIASMKDPSQTPEARKSIDDWNKTKKEVEDLLIKIRMLEDQMKAKLSSLKPPTV